jgi:succinate dehydrogenase/fumarate reductase flavoprotein subunit
MELETTRTINTDLLVIGSGGAGLRAAIEGRKWGVDVLMISESPVGLKNNTAISGGGFCGVGIWRKPEDSPEIYLKDTIIGGRFINDRRMVETMVHGATQQFYDLLRFGVSKWEERYEWITIGGHSYPRTCEPEKERGINITRPMRDYAASMGVQSREGILVTKLLRAEDRVVGALGIDNKGQVFVFNAKSTILATGGAGNIYLRTDNALGATGDGYVLAYELGATLRDMEFVQFYPTGFGPNGNKMMYIEEFFPKGAVLRNSLGEDIVEKYGEKSMTRDILSRIITKEIVAGRGAEGEVTCDFTKISEEKRVGYPSLTRFPEKFGVAPTQHFFMGGVEVSWDVEMGIDGLYAAGEVCGGTQGANRLSCNAITEILVFGTIAGDRAAARASKVDRIPPSQNEVTAEVGRLSELASGKDKENFEQLRMSLKQTMWDKVAVIRDSKSLEDAQREILALREQLTAMSLTDYKQLSQSIKLANMLTVSEMICRAALLRTESRGTHYRADYPEEDNMQWLKKIEICRQNGEMTFSVTPIDVDIEYYKRD